MSTPHGVLIVDKPTQMTSHDVVAQARRRFGTRAVGHAGTLDPAATGVLVLLLGEATKLSPYLTADDKTYRACIRFGRSTDTLDAEGTTTEEQELSLGWLTEPALEAALALERERSAQVPPSFSAIKVGGLRAHRLSRQGQPPELAPREVFVRALSRLSGSDQELVLELTVSKGYYVRSLARDLCGSLGVPGHLAELRRLKSGSFELTDAIPWPAGDARLISVSMAARRALPAVTLRPEGVTKARQGRELADADFESPPVAGSSGWFDAAGNLVAIGEATATAGFRVLRGFAPNVG